MMNQYYKAARTAVAAGLAGLILCTTPIPQAYGQLRMQKPENEQGLAKNQQVNQIIDYIVKNGEKRSVMSDSGGGEGGTSYTVDLDQRIKGFTRDIGFPRGFDVHFFPDKINQPAPYGSEIVVQTAISNAGQKGGLLMMLFDKYIRPDFLKIEGLKVYKAINFKSFLDKDGDGNLDTATIIQYVKRNNEADDILKFGPRNIEGDDFSKARNLYNMLVGLIHSKLTKEKLIK